MFECISTGYLPVIMQYLVTFENKVTGKIRIIDVFSTSRSDAIDTTRDMLNSDYVFVACQRYGD